MEEIIELLEEKFRKFDRGYILGYGAGIRDGIYKVMLLLREHRFLVSKDKLQFELIDLYAEECRENDKKLEKFHKKSEE